MMNYKQDRNGKASGNLLWQSDNIKIFLDIRSLGNSNLEDYLLGGDENY